MVRHGTFRDGSYKKYVLVGKRTVKAGECCSLWKLDGTQRVIVGPKRKYIWRSTVRFLDRHVADPHQYLVVRYQDGKKEHLRGPISIFEDPVKHSSIKVEDGVYVNSFEVIVVYREQEIGEVKRRIVKGPTLFIPDAYEWIHSFSWHGPDPTNKTRIVPNAKQFVKLPTIPDQIYYNIKEVRTSDDAVITVKVMIFYQIEDLEKVLDSTHDPIGDFINSICADLITFSSKVTYEKFLTLTDKLNELETYPLLMSRATNIGFRINKVVYRGYIASQEMQIIHDASIKSASELRKKSENEQLIQNIEDMKISRAMERSEKERKMDAETTQHKLEMESLQHKEKMRQKELEARHEEERIKRQNEQQLAFLKELAKEGVDLTKYLISSNSHVDRVVRVESNSITPNISID